MYILKDLLAFELSDWNHSFSATATYTRCQNAIEQSYRVIMQGRRAGS